MMKKKIFFLIFKKSGLKGLIIKTMILRTLQWNSPIKSQILHGSLTFS
jgi:hypothetical protein